jgi:nucleotide-binding universal stress UspA family protein
MTPHAEAPVLVPVDGSSSASNAAWRAALVARDRGLALHLLQAAAAAASRSQDATQLAAAIRNRIGIPVETRDFAGDALGAIVRAAREASLLVVGTRRGNPLRDFVLGTQAERLLRLARVPVLVVKRPATGGYRRVLVPVDLLPGAGRAIAAASLFSRDPRMEVLHAINVRHEVALRIAEVPEAALRRARNRAIERAQRRLEECIAEAGAWPTDVRPAVTFGDASAAVLARERAMRAELVVMGKRQAGMLADFFLGSVTQRVLARARADVLALPVPQERPAPLGLVRLLAGAAPR